MPEKVVIVGGGVAGLTAAHELVERGFEVHLYERRSRLGGKSASVTSAGGLPGEHGFRFFPGWYRHLPDTLRRIPFKNRTVFDNLVPASESLFASYYRDPIPALLRFPRSLRDLVTLAGFPEHLLRIGLTAGDFAFFFGRLAQFAATTESARVRDFEGRSWWDFMDADARSEQFRAYLVDGITRNTVAADPKQASAYTIATVALRTLMDTVRPDVPVDQVLNGPTSEVWIEPWADYLRAKGVVIHLDAELDSIELEGHKLQSVKFMRHGLKARVLRLLLDPETSAELQREALRELTALGERALAADLADGRKDERRCRRAFECALRESRDDSEPVEADYFVFALPIEQMAYYVNRSCMLQRRDPSLTNIIRLSNHVEWMAGIQFYLTENLELTPGHVDCLDSEWALTAISQAQFWSEVDLKERGNGKVKTILSVDISAWNVEGRKHRKEAFSCTRQEIAEETWDQLQRSLNRANNAPLLRDEYLLGYTGGQRVPPASYHLDQEIVDRFDRKKQAFYKQYESVRFSSEAVAEERREGASLPTLFAHGDRLHMNAEPLFVNRANTLELRPTAKTRIENMFLAADYVRTNTNLATMEAANEAARLAVNEILAVSGSRQTECRIWSLAPAADILSALSSFAQQPGPANTGPGVRPSAMSLAASVLESTARRAFDTFVTRRRR